MEVDISSAVLIFDEAHNIEDNARYLKGYIVLKMQTAPHPFRS